MNESIKAKKTLLYFSTKFCVVCRDLKPKIKDRLKAYPDIGFREIKVEEEPKLAADYQAFTSPLMIYLIDGKEYIREGNAFSLDLYFKKIDRLEELMEED